ncbi:DUF4129 domain-containing protein [Nocardia jinanensis]|uniref:Protein-glutamine gamma-glutamyltransferase-like C-terminal domain-containing protein n=1 Tax=Nocardia jinanensis TaxID=382504 RepID=A0A917RTB0_9NOCA|nr:DUF4129 domain-containing protein [Nocardia jinanensis]GGL25860.1 hypothetical protein GCM10011588_45830 [Nocardia jinanensis]
MTDPDRTVPEQPGLDAAAVHGSAAERAAAHGDFDTALRERFRAVLRGMEQRGLLEVRRSRTARETSHEASASLPTAHSGELPAAAQAFDEVVYGGRSASEDEYRRLTQADRFSAAAPPPAPEPVDIESARRRSRSRRESGEWATILRDPRFWGGVAALALILLVLYAVLQGCSGPSAPRPPDAPPMNPPPDGDYDPDLPRPTGGDSIFDRSPDRLAFGGLQFLIAGALLVWWRARRRGTVVGEPRPVEVAADELLSGQAGLYRRSGDYAHIAGVLRAATVRRLRRSLGAGAAPEELTAAVAARIGADPGTVGAALYGPVPDAQTLELVAAQLEWIEAEVG